MYVGINILLRICLHHDLKEVAFLLSMLSFGTKMGESEEEGYLYS